MPTDLDKEWLGEDGKGLMPHKIKAKTAKEHRLDLRRKTGNVVNSRWLDLWGAMLRTAGGESNIYELAESAGLDVETTLSWFTDPSFTEWLGMEATQYIRAALRMYEVKMANQVMEGNLPPLKVIEYLAKRHDPSFADRKEILHKLEAPDFAQMSILELSTYACSLLPVYAHTDVPVTLKQAQEVKPEPPPPPELTDGSE